MRAHSQPALDSLTARSRWAELYFLKVQVYFPYPLLTFLAKTVLF
jgi:hypothetical protein